MMSNNVIVLGAGIVGVSCALELQRRGVHVTLVDRRGAGEETSYGNAGVLARSSLMPFNNPGLWSSLPRLLRNDTVQFRYNLPFLVRNIRWGVGFLSNARQEVFEETTAALDSLISLSSKEHNRLMNEAGVISRLRTNGWVFLYRSEQAFQGSRLSRETFAKFGVDIEVLSKEGLTALEPDLLPIFKKAIWIKDTQSVDSPGKIVQAYANRFVERGGVVRNLDVKSISQTPSGWRVSDGSGVELVGQRIVVALGPWSQQVLKSAGVHVPMGFERGYHMHYSSRAAATLQRPVYDTGGGYVLSPMEAGLRLSTGVELNACDAPKHPVQLDLAEAAARQAFPLGERLDGEIWMGRRPTLPDSRPIIGQAPGRPGLWLAFGHQHIGFSTGPGTAAVLAALMFGEKPEISAAPFRPERFI
ncbi:D-amino acid dehydrogenase 1 [Cupriavidus pinatubonensis]|uniref:D-amino acid dehydrogenase 1 n=2 Tax=Cupriavidus pinatubonensis TaxID=248026 RepID=A0ABN7ZL69_9BURK|nr:D-amino acid dehydrogenase 1 [Cupriavidus pinatubonensis]